MNFDRHPMPKPHYTQSISSHSKLSDLLPKTILDELEEKTPKASSASSTNLPNNFLYDFPNQSLQTSFTTASSTSIAKFPSQPDRSSFHSSTSLQNHSYSSSTTLYTQNSNYQPQQPLFQPTYPEHYPEYQQPLPNLPQFPYQNNQLQFQPQPYAFNSNTPPCQPRHVMTNANTNDFCQAAPQLVQYQPYSHYQTQKQSITILLDSQINTLVNLNSIQSIIERFNPQTIIELLKTNKGSRHFQKLLNNSPPTQYETDLFSNIISYTIENIMCDYYGNYFLQKFVPYCSLKHRLIFYKHLHKNFYQIANHPCGNHSLQSLIMLQNTKEEEMIIKECVEPNLHKLAFGQNSSHVIQKVIHVIKESNRDYINTFIISNLIDLCLDSNGIGVIKEFIAQMENEFYIMAVVSILELEMHKLTYDQNGNFAIQEIIKHFGIKYCGKIINKIVEHVFMFSISKFSSNVVDCVVDTLFHIDLERFYKIMFKMFFDPECLNEMLKNKYANYVIENSLALLFSNQLSYGNMIDTNYLQLQINIYKILINHPKIKEKNKILSILNSFRYIEQ